MYVCMYNALRSLIGGGHVFDIMSFKTLMQARTNSAKSSMSGIIHVALTMWLGGSKHGMCITDGKSLSTDFMRRYLQFIQVIEYNSCV